MYIVINIFWGKTHLENRVISNLKERPSSINSSKKYLLINEDFYKYFTFLTIIMIILKNNKDR